MDEVCGQLCNWFSFPLWLLIPYVFQAEDKESIMEVVDSAIIDPSVKGGLRWSLGKDSAGGRFYVLETFHMLSKSFVGQTVKLKLRTADRFYLSSHGKISEEVSMKLIGLSKHFKVKPPGFFPFCSILTFFHLPLFITPDFFLPFLIFLPIHSSC